MKPENVEQVSTATIETKAANALDRFYGWRVLAVLWFLFMNFSLVIYGGSVLNAYMARALQMPRDAFGGGISIAYLLMGLAAPLTAAIINRIRPRLTLFFGTMLFAISAFALGTVVKDARGFTIAYGVIAGFGLSIGGLLPLQTLVSNWFIRKRALTTALLLSSGGVGGLLASYLFSYLIETMGLSWQQIWLLIGVFSTLLALLAFFLIHNHPDDVGQRPDGKLSAAALSDRPGNGRARVHQTDVEWSFKDALRTPAFLLILVGSLGMAVSFEFCSAYGVIHLMDIGFSNVVASVSIGVLAFFAIVGRLLTGYLGDRVELRWVMTAGSVMIGVGCLLVLAPPASAIITIYALLAGLGQGLVFVSIFTILPNYYGAKVVPSIFAVAMPFSALATAAVIYLGGIIRTNTGSYSVGFILCAVIAFVAAAASFIAKPPLKK